LTRWFKGAASTNNEVAIAGGDGGGGGRQESLGVGGGDLAGQFADAGLLDEVIVYIAPVTLGSGAPLLPRRVELRLEELGRNRDFACARYAVVRA
jgi:dihydrofolate reductase